MAKQEVFVGDVGTELRFDIGVLVDDITSAVLKVKKPDKTCIEWTPSWTAGEQELVYIVQAGDFDIAGKYSIQPKVTFPTGEWYGSIATLYVAATVCG
jgi:hypothetical protein